MKKSLQIVFFFFFSILFGQGNQSVLADMQNTKIKEIHRIHSQEKIDYSKLKNQYEAILEGNNVEDKVHLFTYESTNPNKLINWMNYAPQLDQIGGFIEDMPDSEYATFAKTMVYFSIAKRLYKENDKKKQYLNFVLHSLLNFVENETDRVVEPFAWTNAELFAIGFVDDHLTEELLLESFRYLWELSTSNKETLISYLRANLYYENVFRIELSSEEKEEYRKRTEISTKIIHHLLQEFPADAPKIAFLLWEDSLVEYSFTRYEVRFKKGFADAFADVWAQSSIAKADKNKVLGIDFLFRYFIERDRSLNLKSFVQLHTTKKQAYDQLMYFIKTLNQNEYLPLDALGVRPEWALFFQDELMANYSTDALYALRFSSDYEYLLSKSTPKDFDQLSEVYQTLQQLGNQESVDLKNTLIFSFDMMNLFEDALKYPHLKNNSNLKKYYADSVLDFEILYLLNKNIHSPTIIYIGSAFENWTKEEKKAYEETLLSKLNQYLIYYKKVAEYSDESFLVLEELEKLVDEFL